MLLAILSASNKLAMDGSKNTSYLTVCCAESIAVSQYTWYNMGHGNVYHDTILVL